VKRTEQHTQPTRDNPQTGEIPRHEKFSLGRIVATPAALAALQRAGQNPLAFLAQHVSADWGEVCEEDRRENEFALQPGFPLLSVSTTQAGEKVWGIAAADRRATTLLLPQAY